MLSKAVVFCFLINSAWSSEERKFPPGFKFGVATAAYQIEGGWNADGKSESIWDSFTHKYAEKIVDHTNGDVACDSYTHWQRDVDLTAELGVDFYRFSVSWTRLMPTGFPDKVSEAGQRYYNNLIDGLIAKGVEPVITLYHWDLPQRLQDLGGWTNPLVVGWFADYARIAFALFGDRVKTWITFNEPILMCEFAYNVVDFAPPISDPGVGDLLCNRHVMLAHATAYRIYEKEFKPKYHDRISMTGICDSNFIEKCRAVMRTQLKTSSQNS